MNSQSSVGCLSLVAYTAQPASMDSMARILSENNWGFLVTSGATRVFGDVSRLPLMHLSYHGAAKGQATVASLRDEESTAECAENAEKIRKNGPKRFAQDTFLLRVTWPRPFGAAFLARARLFLRASVKSIAAGSSSSSGTSTSRPLAFASTSSRSVSAYGSR